jgi:hypothetical protein
MAAASFVSVPVGTEFPLENLPWGMFVRSNDATRRPRLGVALGAHVVDVGALQRAGLLPGPQLSASDRGRQCMQQVPGSRLATGDTQVAIGEASGGWLLPSLHSVTE